MTHHSDTNATNYIRMPRIIRVIRILFGSFGSILIIVIVSLANTVSAQENDLFLVVSPSSPDPRQSYSVEAKSFQFDTSRTFFEWFRNGKKIDEGTGIVKKIFAGEKLGSQNKISVISANNSASANISINDIDFLINPLTYVPQFYRGAPLPTSGSIVEIYAIPHVFSGTSRVSSTNLIFKWSLDGTPVEEQSGKGKSKLIFSLPKTHLGENEISLKVSSLNGELTHEKTEKVAIRRPEIVLYKSSPLLGKSARALSSFETKSGEEFSVVAEPFFFDFNSILRGTFLWLANGTKISKGAEKNPFLLELSSQSGIESENNISFKIEDKENVFQKGEGRITIKVKP